MPTASKAVALEFCKRFPKAGHSVVARAAYKAHPESFANVDAARSAIRKVRGKHGNFHRSVAAVKEHYETEPRSCAGCAKLPEPWAYMDDVSDFRIEGPAKVLVISDLHIPYHDLPTIKAAWKDGKRRKIDTIFINGDLPDFHKISRWQQDPRERDFEGEVLALQQFMAAMHDEFPKARKVWKLGNHCERWTLYLMDKAAELLGIPEFQLEEISHANKFGVEVVKDMRKVMLGKLATLHGHEYKFSISNPVNPARGMFLRAKVSILGAHFHQSSEHSEKDLNDHVVSCWTAGCMCNMRPRYMPYNKWNHGFTETEIFSDGAYEVSNLRVINGKAY